MDVVLALYLMILLLDPLGRDHELLDHLEDEAAEVDVLGEGGLEGFREEAHLKLSVGFQKLELHVLDVYQR